MHEDETTEGFAMSMPEAVRFWARCRPDSIALEFEGRSWSWRELDQSTSEVAAGLLALDVVPGDRVGVFMDNCEQWCQTVIACGKARLVLVPLNVRMTASELQFAVGHAGCRVVVIDDAHAEQVGLAALDENVHIVTVSDRVTSGSQMWQDLPIDGVGDAGEVAGDDEVACLCFTSGTTGRSKAVMITHGNVTALASKNGLADALTHNDRSYLPGSLSFTGSLLTVWAPIAHAGGTLVLTRDFDAAATVEALTSGITVFYGPVPMWALMASVPGVDECDFSLVRVARAGAGPVPLAQLKAWQARGLLLGQGYGCTESTGSGILLPPWQAIAKSGAAGIPSMGTQVRIVDKEGDECAAGAVGELLMRGSEVMAGYWSDPIATAEALRDGWLHTGDLATRDADGYITIVDRKKDMYVSGGLNVYPAEVERVIAGIPGVLAAAVVARPDPTWGEVGVAFVDAEPGRVTVEEVVAACRTELSDYKRPRIVLIESAVLPRTISGKVVKKTLRDRAIALDASEVLNKDE